MERSTSLELLRLPLPSPVTKTRRFFLELAAAASPVFVLAVDGSGFTLGSSSKL